MAPASVASICRDPLSSSLRCNLHPLSRPWPRPSPNPTEYLRVQPSYPSRSHNIVLPPSPCQTASPPLLYRQETVALTSLRSPPPPPLPSRPRSRNPPVHPERDLPHNGLPAAQPPLSLGHLARLDQSFPQAWHHQHHHHHRHYPHHPSS